jgi:hypothetical protein
VLSFLLDGHAALIVLLFTLEFLKQFYTTAANIFNENYSEPIVTDDDLPF